MSLEERRELARHCFGCGRDNSTGLRLRFRLIEDRVEAEFTPRPEHQGFPGMMHGGIAATLLDEAMGWAAYALGVLAFTAKMETRFRRPIPIAAPLKITGQLQGDRGRSLRARAEIRSREGELMAEAQGVFMRAADSSAGKG